MCTSQFMLSVSSTSVCDWECVLSSHRALSLLHLTNTNESPFLTRIDCLAHVHAFNTHFIELLSCSFYFTWTFHFNETKKNPFTPHCFLFRYTFLEHRCSLLAHNTQSFVLAFFSIQNSFSYYSTCPFYGEHGVALRIFLLSMPKITHGIAKMNKRQAV